jgi:hypothetical protein
MVKGDASFGDAQVVFLILGADHSSTFITDSEYNVSEIARVRNGGFL